MPVVDVHVSLRMRVMSAIGGNKHHHRTLIPLEGVFAGLTVVLVERADRQSDAGLGPDFLGG